MPGWWPGGNHGWRAGIRAGSLVSAFRVPHSAFRALRLNMIGGPWIVFRCSLCVLGRLWDPQAYPAREAHARDRIAASGVAVAALQRLLRRPGSRSRAGRPLVPHPSLGCLAARGGIGVAHAAGAGAGAGAGQVPTRLGGGMAAHPLGQDRFGPATLRAQVARLGPRPRSDQISD